MLWQTTDMASNFASSITPQEIELLPKAEFTGKITVIHQIGPSYYAAIKHLRKEKILGFDTETKPQFEHTGVHNMVALLQLSTADHAYLFRLTEIGIPSGLMEILSDPAIIKVGAACHDDFHGLREYGPFHEANVIDLQKMVKDYGINDLSVKKMAAIILGVRISKAQQLSNWEAFHFSDAQKIYAATDAWICREMYIRLTSSAPETTL